MLVNDSKLSVHDVLLRDVMQSKPVWKVDLTFITFSAPKALSNIYFKCHEEKTLIF